MDPTQTMTPPAGLKDAFDLPEGLPPGGQTADVDAPPTVQPPSSGEVDLPFGYFTPDGVRHSNARVRELTGEDEEALAQYNWTKNPAEYVTQLVSRATLSVGTVPMTPAVSRALTTGDRNMLTLAIRKVTFGQEIEISLYCPACDVKSDVFFDIDTDIPIVRLEEPDGRYFDVPLKSGKIAHVVFPTGEVHERCLSSQRTDAEINTIMLSLCVRDIDGVPLGGEETARKLGLADRRALIEFVMEKQPGPRWDKVEAPCHRCLRTYPTPLSIGDLFR